MNDKATASNGNSSTAALQEKKRNSVKHQNAPTGAWVHRQQQPQPKKSNSSYTATTDAAIAARNSLLQLGLLLWPLSAGMQSRKNTLPRADAAQSATVDTTVAATAATQENTAAVGAATATAADSTFGC